MCEVVGFVMLRGLIIGPVHLRAGDHRSEKIHPDRLGG